MQLGIIGLGRMGANIARRLMRAGHACAVHDVAQDAIDAVVRDGAAGAKTLEALAGTLSTPRAVWIMVPADAVEATLAKLEPLLGADDIVIDGGNSHYTNAIRRAAGLRKRGIHFLDVGTSGGVWGLEHGYCLTVGGDAGVARRLEPLFRALAPDNGFLHCGPTGAGHFVKMVHNGIEYGVMAAYAEGFNLLHHAQQAGYRFDVGAVAEAWRHGSVVRSWLLDLIARALVKDPQLTQMKGAVSDSGEGRWAVQAAVDASVPVPVLSAALFGRFASRGEDDFANRLLSAMRSEFGGHRE